MGGEIVKSSGIRVVLLIIYLITQSVIGFAQESSDEVKYQLSAESPKHSTNYLDSRERMASGLTFSWRIEGTHFVPLERIEKKKQELKDILGKEVQVETALEEGIYQSGDFFVIPNLEGIYMIQRSPRATRLYRARETPLISVERIGKSSPLSWIAYFLGATGEALITFVEEPGQVEIYELGQNGIGLYSPNRGPFVGDMCFLGGVSPLRLLGAEPSDWQIVHVSESEWVFEISSDKIRRKMGQLLSKLERVQIRLDRTKGDAPARAEIIMSDGAYLWEVEAYKQFQGVWWPSRVRFQWAGGTTLYELESIQLTKDPVILDIPSGVHTYDWRFLQRAVFEFVQFEYLSDASKAEQGSVYQGWSLELAQSLWRAYVGGKSE